MHVLHVCIVNAESRPGAQIRSKEITLHYLEKKISIYQFADKSFDINAQIEWHNESILFYSIP